MSEATRGDAPNVSRIYMEGGSGKTTLAIQMVKGWQAMGFRAAYVVPSRDAAEFFRQGFGLSDVLCPGRLLEVGDSYQVLVLDDCERFPQGEGDPLALAAALVARRHSVFSQVVGFFTRRESPEVSVKPLRIDVDREKAARSALEAAGMLKPASAPSPITGEQIDELQRLMEARVRHGRAGYSDHQTLALISRVKLACLDVIGCDDEVAKWEFGEQQGIPLVIGDDGVPRVMPGAVAAIPEAAGQAVEALYNERLRQVMAEGWSPEHDDRHREGELVGATISYALEGLRLGQGMPPRDTPHQGWPWAPEWWKPEGGARRCLEKAGALLLAELERMERAEKAEGRQV